MRFVLLHQQLDQIKSNFLILIASWGATLETTEGETAQSLFERGGSSLSVEKKKYHFLLNFLL
jgi:hypothetical protein